MTLDATGVGADFDDETGSIKLLVDLHVAASNASAGNILVGFRVMTTAAI